MFRGGLRLVFTFVIPLALMTTFPALALLGRLEVMDIVLPIAGAVVFSAFSRVVWLRSIGRYTSASS